MANDPEEKQPPVPPAGETPAAKPPSATPPAQATGDAPAKPAAPAASPPKPPAPPAAAGPPKPPVPPKEAPPKPEPLDNDLVKRYRARFGDSIREATTDRKQAILVVARERLVEIAQYSRDDEQFNFLTDLTAVDWPKRERRFDVVLNLYSVPKNERLRTFLGQVLKA